MNPMQEKQYLEGVPRDVQDMIYAGRKIEAIKALRVKTGQGLKESKEMVERIEEKMRAAFPGAAFENRGTGCGVSAAMFAVALAGAVLWVAGRVG